MQFMGGATDIITSDTPYYRAAEYLYKLTLQANQQGDYIPMWGTCLGFELLGKASSAEVSLIVRVVPFSAIITSQNFSLMGDINFASDNVSLPLVGILGHPGRCPRSHPLVGVLGHSPW